jgi:DNA replication and repair protein RecF
MLLDDVMSELDSARRERLVELLTAGGQAVITTTDLEHVPGAEGVGSLAVMSGQLAQEPVA